MSIEDIDSQYHVQQAPFAYDEWHNDDGIFLLDDLLEYELSAVNALIEKEIRKKTTEAEGVIQDEINSAAYDKYDLTKVGPLGETWTFDAGGATQEIDGKKYIKDPPEGYVPIYLHVHERQPGNRSYGGKHLTDKQAPRMPDGTLNWEDFYYKQADGSNVELKIEDFWKSVGSRDSIKTWEDFFQAWRNFLESSFLKDFTVNVYQFNPNADLPGNDIDEYLRIVGGHYDSGWVTDKLFGDNDSLCVTNVTGRERFDDGDLFWEHYLLSARPEDHPEWFTITDTITVDLSDVFSDISFGSVPIDEPLVLDGEGGPSPDEDRIYTDKNYYIDLVKEDMYASWGLEIDSYGDPVLTGSDWDEVIEKVQTLTGNAATNEEIMEDLVKSSWMGFTGFLRQKYKAGDLYTDVKDSTTIDTGKVSGLYAEFCKTTTHIDTSAGFTEQDWSPLIPDPSDPDYVPPERVQFQSFETAFFAFNPTASHDDFVNELATTILIQLNNGDYFTPTHFFEKWIDHLKAPTMGSVSPIFEKDTNDMRIKQAMVLNEVFDILIEMIGVIQGAAASQARRLKFYSEWQNQFTDMLKEVKSIHGGDSTETQQKNLRISETRETLRSYRDIIGDEVKQNQQTVNQINDAASQQANIASSILQQLEGILTLIFR